MVELDYTWAIGVGCLASSLWTFPKSTLVVLSTFEVLWLIASYSAWKYHFKCRFTKNQKECPSNADSPSVQSMKETMNTVKGIYKSWHTVAKILGRKPKVEPTNNIGISADMEQSISRWKQRAACRMDSDKVAEAKHPRTGPKAKLQGTGAQPQAMREESEDFPTMTVTFTAKDEETRAKHLDMDHLNLTLAQYMWAAHFVSLPSAMQLFLGIFNLCVLKLMKRLGLVPKPTKERMSEVAAGMLLETSNSINLSRIIAASEDSPAIAEFVWPSIALIIDIGENHDKTISALSMLKCQVDLSTKRAIQASVSTQQKTIEVEMNDLVPILAHVLSAYQHPKVHAYANWGIDPGTYSEVKVHPHLQKMSVVTTLFNHLGFHNAPGIFGLMYGEEAGGAFLGTVEKALTLPTPSHTQVRHLMKHSRLVKFISCLRVPFFELFKEHRSEFPPRTDAEAYFLGTVMHSLDHAMYAEQLDPWVFVGLDPSPQYRSLKKIQETVRFSLSTDLPMILFNRFYRKSPFAFHRKVYQKACTLDQKLADMIQTCIIK